MRRMSAAKVWFCQLSEKSGGGQTDDDNDNSAGNQYPADTVRKQIKQNAINDLSGRLSAQGESKYIRHHLSHQVFRCVGLYHGDGIGGKQAASQLAGAEHNKKDQIAGKGMKGE